MKRQEGSRLAKNVKRRAKARKGQGNGRET